MEHHMCVHGIWAGPCKGAASTVGHTTCHSCADRMLRLTADLRVAHLYCSTGLWPRQVLAEQTLTPYAGAHPQFRQCWRLRKHRKSISKKTRTQQEFAADKDHKPCHHLMHCCTSVQPACGQSFTLAGLNRYRVNDWAAHNTHVKHKGRSPFTNTQSSLLPATCSTGNKTQDNTLGLLLTAGPQHSRQLHVCQQCC